MIGGALSALVLLAPTVLSMGTLRSIVQAQLQTHTRGEAHVEAASFGWLSGLELEGLRVGNPAGFSDERPAVSLQRLQADVSLAALLFGSLEASGEVTGLEVNLEQRSDGRTNLQELAVDAQAPASDPQSAGAPAADRGGPTPFALDFRVRDSAVTIRRTGPEIAADDELLEAMTDLQCHAASASDSDEIDVEVAGKLRAGDLAVALKLDPAAETTDAELTAHGLDLAAWRPLLDAMLPGQFTALTGRVDGDVTARLHRGDQVELGGDLVIDAPRVAGPIVRGMDLRSARWQLTPALTLGSGASSDIDASSFAVDLEWLRLHGEPASREGRVAVRYDVDVAALAEFGGPIPALLKGSGTKLAGKVDVPTGDLPDDVAGWAQAIAASAGLRIQALDLGGFSLRDLGLDLDVEGGKLTLDTTPDAELDGGALALSFGVDLNDFANLPTTASIQWEGGKLTGGATRSLRYLMPMFAGLDSQLADVLGDVDVDLSFAGPARKDDAETWLKWLDGWSGDGSLGLAGTTFSPSKSLQGLLQPLGALSATLAPIADGGKLRIDSLKAPFSLSKGRLATRGAKWLAAGKEIGLDGTVGLDGVVDYSLDFAALLRGHKDGERVLAALGGKLPGARLTGSLDAPTLGLPEVGDIATKLLEQQAKQLLEGNITEGLQGLFGGRKKKKDRD
ncbi:MAG: AsmA family protein [Planctomycetota bacterium]